MKYCSVCKTEVPDSYSFCKYCGGPVHEVRAAEICGGESCPACGAQVDSGWRFCKQCAYDLQAEPVPHLNSQPCRRCGSPVAVGLNFCEECGTPVEVSHPKAVMPVASFGTGAVATPTEVIEPDELTLRPVPFRVSRRLQLGLIAAAIVVLLALGGFAVYYFSYSNSAIENELDAAIKRGDFFKPEGASAYDYYHQLKNNGADESVLGRYAERIIPQIIGQPTKMLADFAVPTDKDPGLADWQNALKLMAWASEMKPSDNALAARAKYIEGRVAYLSKRENEALDLWKRSSDLDKSWALPPNGVGLIYNERKDYQTARPYLLEAIRREAGWAVPYNNLGTSYFMQKDYDNAETYYLQALERAGNWPRPHVWLGDIAMLRSDFDRAANEYQTVLDLARPDATTINLSEIKKKLEQAKKKSQQAIIEGEQAALRELDLDVYCKSIHGNSAIAFNIGEGNANAWRCMVEQAGNQQYFEMNVNEACQMQFGSHFTAQVNYLSRGSETWNCVPIGRN